MFYLFWFNQGNVCKWVIHWVAKRWCFYSKILWKILVVSFNVKPMIKYALTLRPRQYSYWRLNIIKMTFYWIFRLDDAAFNKLYFIETLLFSALYLKIDLMYWRQLHIFNVSVMCILNMLLSGSIDNFHYQNSKSFYFFNDILLTEFDPWPLNFSLAVYYK